MFPTSSLSQTNSPSAYWRMVARCVYGTSVGMRLALGVLAIWILDTFQGMRPLILSVGRGFRKASLVALRLSGRPRRPVS